MVISVHNKGKKRMLFVLKLSAGLDMQINTKPSAFSFIWDCSKEDGWKTWSYISTNWSIPKEVAKAAVDTVMHAILLLVSGGG